MNNYELNPRKISLRALQIRERVFDNGGRSMYQFSFDEKERIKMAEDVLSFEQESVEENNEET